MDLSHRRSASTATNNINTSDLQAQRLRARPDASPNAEPQKRRKEEDGQSNDSDMTSSDDFELDDMLSDDGLDDDEETGLTSGDRRKRRKRKRRNTLLDQRIAPGLDTQREEEERLARASFWSAILINSILIGLWYIFSISITLVCHPPVHGSYSSNKPVVQQMDVQKRKRRTRNCLSFPTLHHMRTYDCPVYIGIFGPLLSAQISTST